MIAALLLRHSQGEQTSHCKKHDYQDGKREYQGGIVQSVGKVFALIRTDVRDWVFR